MRRTIQYPATDNLSPDQRMGGTRPKKQWRESSFSIYGSRLHSSSVVTIRTLESPVSAAIDLSKVSPLIYDDERESAEIGLRIAPDFINIAGKDPKLVRLGSFIVNGQADCNGCHGSDPANEYLPTNNP